jgi:hypothetical protein
MAARKNSIVSCLGSITTRRPERTCRDAPSNDLERLHHRSRSRRLPNDLSGGPEAPRQVDGDWKVFAVPCESGRQGDLNFRSMISRILRAAPGSSRSMILLLIRKTICRRPAGLRPEPGRGPPRPDFWSGCFIKCLLGSIFSSLIVISLWGLRHILLIARGRGRYQCCKNFRRQPLNTSGENGNVHAGKRFGDAVGLQAQATTTTSWPLSGGRVETVVDLARIAGEVCGKVPVVFHRELPPGAKIKQLALTIRGDRMFVIRKLVFYVLNSAENRAILNRSKSKGCILESYLMRSASVKSMPRRSVAGAVGG